MCNVHICLKKSETLVSLSAWVGRLDHCYVPPFLGVGAVGDAPGVAIDGIHRPIVRLLPVDVAGGVATAASGVDRKRWDRWSAFVDVVVVQERHLIVLGVGLGAIELLGPVVVHQVIHEGRLRMMGMVWVVFLE